MNEEFKAINETLLQIRLLLTAQGKDLEEHMRRTEIVEQTLEIHKAEMIKLKTIFMVVGWIVGSISTIAPLVLEVWKRVH